MLDVKGRHISPHNVSRGLLISTIAGAIGMVFFVATGGAFITGFARKLGATQFQIGIINAFLPMAAISQLASSYMIERRGWLRKPVLCISASVMRLLWLPILLIPFIFGYTGGHTPSPGLKTLAIGLALGLMALSQLLNSFGGLAWQAWMGDLVPPDRRGRFFGTRTTVVNAVAVAVGIAMGKYLDIAHGFGAFAVIFGIGVFFGVVDLIVHAFVPEPKPTLAPADQPFLTMFRNPFKDKYFKGLIWFCIAWSFSVWIMLPFLPVFQIESLRMSYLSITNFGNLFTFALMGSSVFAGKAVDRFGGKPVFIWSYSLLTTMPLFWLSMTHDMHVVQFAVMNTLSGILNAGVMVSTNQLLLENSPQKERSIYIAAFSAITGLAGGLSPILGGWVGDRIGSGSLDLGLFSLSGLKVVFMLSLIARLCCLPLLRMVGEGRKGEEPEGTGVPLPVV